ncbi:cytochrome c/c1 heme-lyase, partial [Polychytrium aggregatum]|uniref:cytochrome c/c1 heme-lyase n=1 Tax=Polychytrium aggregatum TaxID=110093 RepID=UPI0022FF23C2
LNPQNMMPHLGNSMAPGQDKPLPTERTASIIPKADETGKTWAYPSPQQFYNALNRKGWETPVDAVPMMVDIHNFLNDACWEEIMKWEREYHCDCKDVKLARFMGRPHDLSPKARIYGFFGAEKPFDRHDWVVDRCGKEVRYVIDYYGGYPEGDNPVFHVDVRPALDSPSAFFDR